MADSTKKTPQKWYLTVWKWAPNGKCFEWEHGDEVDFPRYFQDQFDGAGPKIGGADPRDLPKAVINGRGDGIGRTIFPSIPWRISYSNHWRNSCSSWKSRRWRITKVLSQKIPIIEDMDGAIECHWKNLAEPNKKNPPAKRGWKIPELTIWRCRSQTRWLFWQAMEGDTRGVKSLRNPWGRCVYHPGSSSKVPPCSN